MTDYDFTAMTPNEINHFVEEATKELGRRRTIQYAERDMNKLATEYLDATGEENGSEWKQPSGSLGAYPEWRIVFHNGKRWESLITGNFTEPGNSADPQSARWWKDLDAVEDDGIWTPNYYRYEVGDEILHIDAYYVAIQAHTSQPDWSPDLTPSLWEPTDPGAGEEPVDPPVEDDGVEWSGNAVSYKVGDIRTFEGQEYEVIAAHDSQQGWNPPASPSLWKIVPEATEGVPEYVHGTLYSKGGQVMFETEKYESLIDNNSWSPTEYPAGWSKVA